jgi:hypothetical protein|nr:hypothetical protein [uncultured Steroidobacter sp.]
MSSHRKIVFLVGVLAAAPLVVFAASWWLYAATVGRDLMPQAQEWGQFGDFIGGFVGTVIGASTLLAIALTVYLQAKTLTALAEQKTQLDEQVQHARDSAESARSANELSRDIFLGTQRPWITISLKPAGLRYVDGAIRVQLEVTLKNVGNSPAMNVFFSASLHIDGVGITAAGDVRSVQRQLLEIMKTGPTSAWGYALFPGESLTHPIEFGLSKEEFASVTQGLAVILPYVIGVANYNFAFEGGGTHHTSCVMRLSRVNRKRPKADELNRSLTAIFIDDGDIPGIDLSLLREFGGDYAD